jgi:hypothetical protein
MENALVVTLTASGVRLDVHVSPRASKSVISGVRDGRLLVRVTAAPVDDAANNAVIASLAKALNVPKRAIRIASGATSRNKRIEIAGLGEAAVRARLAAILA